MIGFRRGALLFASVLIILSCSENKFRGGSDRGNSTPEEEPLDLSREDPDQPRDEQGNPLGPDGQDSPRPGQGIDPRTGQVPGAIPGRNNNPNDPRNDHLAPILTEQVFEARCSDGTTVIHEFAAPESQRIKAVIKGEVCNDFSHNVNVLFVVDFSGSMGPHFDSDTNGESSGHDPLINGTCGRLEAARQIITRMEAEGSNVNISLIPFANKAVENMVVDPMQLSKFKLAHLNKRNFCRYVAQEGRKHFGESLNVADVGGELKELTPSTNYGAAFARAHQAIVSRPQANNIVYFISDGEPTSPGGGSSFNQEALAAGVTSGQALRDDPNIQNLIINGLYLGNPGTITYQNAKQVLDQVTGSPDRVVPVENAAGLSTGIEQFPDPSVNIDTDQYRKMARLFVFPYTTANLGIQSLFEVEPHRWEYVTQPFLLLGRPGREIENRVVINIVGRRGSIYKTTVRIKYRMQ